MGKRKWEVGGAGKGWRAHHRPCCLICVFNSVCVCGFLRPLIVHFLGALADGLNVHICAVKTKKPNHPLRKCTRLQTQNKRTQQTAADTGHISCFTMSFICVFFVFRLLHFIFIIWLPSFPRERVSRGRRHTHERFEERLRCMD